MDRFEFIGFVPRRALEVYANQALERVLSQMPSDCFVRAQAIFQGSEFHYSVRIASMYGTFFGASTIRPNSHALADRNWQKVAIDQIIYRLRDQIADWHHSRRRN